MKIVIISKSPFNVITLSNASSVTYSNGIYSVTVGSTTTTYSEDNYLVRIM